METNRWAPNFPPLGFARRSIITSMKMTPEKVSELGLGLGLADTREFRADAGDGFIALYRLISMQEVDEGLIEITVKPAESIYDVISLPEDSPRSAFPVG